MTPLRTLVPEGKSLAAMQTADLAGYILEVLMSAGPMERGVWNRRNFCMQTGREYALPGQPADDGVGIACSSAWSWLEANGFIARHPEQDNEWYLRAAKVHFREVPSVCETSPVEPDPVKT